MNKITGIIIICLVIIGVVLGYNWWHKKKLDSDQPQVSETIPLAENDQTAEASAAGQRRAREPELEFTHHAATLVVYFSRSGENYGVGVVEPGNTALLAQAIAEQTGADLFEIAPVEAYPEEYKAATEVAKAEQEVKARPDYQYDIDISDYQTIFLGYPIWWDDLPMIVYHFLEDHDFAGKNVYLFNTHEGSGDAGTYQKIAEMLVGANVITDGLTLTGQAARTPEGQESLLQWLAVHGFYDMADYYGVPLDEIDDTVQETEEEIEEVAE